MKEDIENLKQNLYDSFEALPAKKKLLVYEQINRLTLILNNIVNILEEEND